MSMTEAGVVFEHSHWPGLFICEVKHRACFNTYEEMAAFIAKYCPSTKIVHKGRCSHCGYLHFKGKHPGPSGASSGTDKRS